MMSHEENTKSQVNMLSGQNEETELEKLNARAIVSSNGCPLPARSIGGTYISGTLVSLCNCRHMERATQNNLHGARHSSKYLAWSAYTPQNNLHGAHMELGIQNSSAQFELAV